MKEFGSLGARPRRPPPLDPPMVFFRSHHHYLRKGVIHPSSMKGAKHNQFAINIVHSLLQILFKYFHGVSKEIINYTNYKASVGFFRCHVT